VAEPDGNVEMHRLQTLIYPRVCGLMGTYVPQTRHPLWPARCLWQQVCREARPYGKVAGQYYRLGGSGYRMAKLPDLVKIVSLTDQAWTRCPRWAFAS
jgi:hypothetical protein